MKPKVSVYIAQSLDGFIARPDGGLDWLDEREHPAGEDYGFRAFMDSVDVLVMGRHTYEKVLSFGGDWPYGTTRVVVLSSGRPEIPPHLAQSVAALSGPPAEVVARLASEGAKRIYVDGGLTIQRFLAAGLVDELILTTIPVLIGEGIPLFAALEEDVPLEHVETRAFAGGLVQSTYRITGRR